MEINGDDTSPPPSLSRKLRPHSFTDRYNFKSTPVLREDCWSEESTSALIEAWGSHHLSLNRGNLRQHHWSEVAAAVNSSGENRRRTDTQCKNRIDTLKKKYKIEKSKTVDSFGSYVSPWPFFSRLDYLIAGVSEDSVSSRKVSPETPVPTNFPVAPRSMITRKRTSMVDDSFFRRNFVDVVAAAAKVEEEEERGRVSSEPTGTFSGVTRREQTEREENGSYKDGCRQLAEAIMRFGEVYERVEAVKQEQLIELEKHRLEFVKDLEYQRMKLLMDTQIQLARIKRSKHSDGADSYL
ncbi:trihelix transcription factor ENAP1-like [Amaranthus tricolor]|uniref:trihelix transcription factor ENAP1-like n=1 Tax=Amaranthus tricolor TaxID=29722 RepID=UPI0025909A8A|nr:trihelix transcription factor ENAP1-like [Amaranthus tricolor]